MPIPIALRDQLITEFRYHLCQKLGLTPFLHQADWWTASDGYDLTPVQVSPTDPRPHIACLNDQEETEYRLLCARPDGRAKVLALLGAYKAGKSWSAGVWASSFAAAPGAKVYLVGSVYDMCAPEFEYIAETLLSDRGMRLNYKSYKNNPKIGAMYLELENGAKFEARSWESRESLKGKEVDAYVYPVAAGTKVWMGDFLFTNIEEVKVGDTVIGWAKKAGSSRDFLTKATVLQTHCKYDQVVQLHLEDGTVLRCSPDHKWQIAERADGRGNYAYRAAKLGDYVCRVIADPGACPAPLKEQAAWLGGIYDGEGSRFSIAQGRKNAGVCRAIESALTALGFEYGVSNAGNGVNYYNIKGGRQAALKFLLWVPSIRFREKYAAGLLLSARFRCPTKVVKIVEEHIEQPVHCLTTTTGNFIADGTASSNCEAYQLPGIECFTSVRQNLRARSGYAVFPTTPDRPWVAILHQNGHGREPGWVCKCGVPSSANPITYDAQIMESDRKLMTREKFQIAHGGQLGNYIGSVFDYQIGTREIGLSSHPDLWHNPNAAPTKENFKLPHNWHIVIGSDTGTFMAALYIAISPEGDTYILDELTNYTYIGGVPEVIPAVSVQVWADQFKRKAATWNARCAAWADSNSQFKVELAHHGIGILPNHRGREVRTEAAREYFQHRKVHLAPWLSILPYELENAKYPDEATMGGRFERVKGDNNDHLVDCMEHIYSRHPRGRGSPRPQTQPVIPGYTMPLVRKRRLPANFDPHLGGL